MNNNNNLNPNYLSDASTVKNGNQDNNVNNVNNENQDPPFTERQQYLMKIMIERILDDREKRRADQVSGGGRRNKNKKSQRKSKKTQKKSKNKTKNPIKNKTENNYLI